MSVNYNLRALKIKSSYIINELSKGIIFLCFNFEGDKSEFRNESSLNLK